MDKRKKIAPFILRIGISAVFLWFGFDQLVHGSKWISYVPDYAVNLSPFDALTLVYINGAMEMIFGLCLASGIYTRISALILALHMLHITFTVGFDAIGVRDFGIAIATITAYLLGSDEFTLDYSLLNIS